MLKASTGPALSTLSDTAKYATRRRPTDWAGRRAAQIPNRLREELGRPLMSSASYLLSLVTCGRRLLFAQIVSMATSTPPPTAGVACASDLERIVEKMLICLFRQMLNTILGVAEYERPLVDNDEAYSHRLS